MLVRDLARRRVAALASGLLLLALGLAVGVAPDAVAGVCQTSTKVPLSSVTLAPNLTSATVGTQHTITATVTVSDPAAAPSGFCIEFTQLAGPSTGWPRYGVTDGKGNASVTWTSYTTSPNNDTDSIRATALDPQGQPLGSADIRHTWTPKPTPAPTPRRTVSPRPSAVTSPTPRRTPPPTPSPSASARPSPTVTPTATPTASPTPSPTTSPAPPAGPALDDGSIQLDRPSALPGGAVPLHGRNCPAGARVAYTVEGAPAGATTAAPDGTFSGDVQLPDASIGEHVIQVECDGRTAAVPVDLVVASSTSTPAAGATAGAVLVFFVLLGSVLLSRHRPARPRQET
ncbi:MAG: hypothetical protein WCD35_06025 [Mycobacteriales bacterium]